MDGYLDFFDDEPAEPDQVVEPDQVAVAPVSGSQVCRFQPREKRHLVEIVGKKVKAAARKFKRFYNSRGCASDRKAWNLDMQWRKAKKQLQQNESDALDLLASLQKRSGREACLKVARTNKGHLFRRSRLVKVMQCKFTAKGNQHGTAWHMRDFLAASFGRSSKGRIFSLRGQALAESMSPATVAYMRVVSCGAVLARQAHLLARIFLMCRSNPPTVVGIRDAWDETGQELMVQGEQGVWQVIAASHTLIMGWPGTATTPMLVEVPVVIPPILVVSPSADRLYYALKNHPSLATILLLENAILKTGVERIHLHESDAAAANERLYHHRLNSCKGDGTLREQILCQCHQSNLAQGSLVSVGHGKLISDLFSFTHFLQAGTHYSKLKHAVTEYCKSACILVTTDHVQKSREVDGYLNEICSLQHGVKQALVRVHSDQDGDVSRRGRFESKLELFKKMFNQDLSSGKIVHICKRSGPSSSWCCPSDDVAKQRLAESLIGVGLPSLPETPAPGKWTKLWSSLTRLFIPVTVAKLLIL